jgi:nuclear pore complex protein Nup98-Nup96
LFGSGTGSSGFGGTTSAFGQASNTGAGFGTTNTSTPPSTDTVAFTPVIEKDGTGTVAFQALTTMEQYKPWSFEELRAADYTKGKRFGNSNGQAGAFGQSTGFGTGFGSTGFGSSSNTGSGFGSNNQNSSFGQSSSGFGSGGGGLFGASKPATGGGLFGSATTSGQSGGGLFGTAGSGTGGFGSSSNTGGFGSGSAGGGLFGQNNQSQNQNKPFGSTGFGGTSTGTTTGFGASTSGGFGQNNQSGGGLFGSQQNTTGGGLFGNNNNNNNQQQQQQQGSTGFGGFGQNQSTQNNQQQSGGLFGGSFGQNNQQQQGQQTGGLFGNKSGTTGGGLFGSNTNQQQSGGLFGTANNQNQQQQQGGLFGGAKPSTGGLFGGSTSGTAGTGGGLFGNTTTGQNQQPQGTGLFGQSQNQPKSLFGATTTGSTTGGGLFGLGQNNSQNQGGLFGGAQNSQQVQPNASLFGSSAPPQQQPSNLFASLDQNPYGNDQLFANLGTPSQSVGPIATPLSSSQKAKRSAILPQHKINPAASTRLITPQKRAPVGFGFSYSTYGTPGSAMSSASPGGSFLGSSTFSRTLGRSYSTNNLRGSYASPDSILAPGAFSPTPRNYGAGSLKRLTIDRSVNGRSIFANPETNGVANPSPLKKSVSFDPSTGGSGDANGSTVNGSTAGALVPVVDKEREAFLNGTSGPVKEVTNGVPSKPTKLQVNGEPLATVPEGNVNKNSIPTDMKDKTLGAYWSEPSIAELRKMSPRDLKALKDFKVGRTNGGQLQFLKPVDLSNYNLDRILDDIIVIQIRSVTVYGGACSYPKPPMGQGLNIPARISLDNSWPRAAGGKLPVHEKKGARFEKHIARLQRLKDTKFVDYNKDTGVWTFEVDHFTTYGLDYDEDDDTLDESALSALPDTPVANGVSNGMAMTNGDHPSPDGLTISSTSSTPDDTFQFKKFKSGASFGSFGENSLFEANDVEADPLASSQNTQSFLGDRSMGSSSEGQLDELMSEDGQDMGNDQDMAGSFHAPVRSMGLISAAPESTQPKSILKASIARRATQETHSDTEFALADDWAEQLQQTVSPKKRDREVLRESQGRYLNEHGGSTKIFQNSTGPKSMSNSIDLMQSLWGPPKVSVKNTAKGRKAQALQV